MLWRVNNTTSNDRLLSNTFVFISLYAYICLCLLGFQHFLISIQIFVSISTSIYIQIGRYLYMYTCSTKKKYKCRKSHDNRNNTHRYQTTTNLISQTTDHSSQTKKKRIIYVFICIRFITTSQNRKDRKTNINIDSRHLKHQC
jgi:hypothetical protein